MKKLLLLLLLSLAFVAANAQTKYKVKLVDNFNLATAGNQRWTLDITNDWVWAIQVEWANVVGVGDVKVQHKTSATAVNWVDYFCNMHSAVDNTTTAVIFEDLISTGDKLALYLTKGTLTGGTLNVWVIFNYKK